MTSNNPLVEEKHFPFYSGSGVAFITLSTNDLCFQILYCTYMLTNHPVTTGYHPLQIRLVKCFIGEVNASEPIAEFVSLLDGFEGAKSIVHSLINSQQISP